MERKKKKKELTFPMVLACARFFLGILSQNFFLVFLFQQTTSLFAKEIQNVAWIL